MDAYAAMPVESFGMALLRCGEGRACSGWRAERGIVAGVVVRCLRPLDERSPHLRPAAALRDLAAAVVHSMQPPCAQHAACDRPLLKPPRLPAVAAPRRGMGWEEGRAIGRGAKEEVKAKELVRCGW